jgi:hypothetical protein
VQRGVEGFHPQIVLLIHLRSLEITSQRLHDNAALIHPDDLRVKAVKPDPAITADLHEKTFFLFQPLLERLFE